MCAGGHDDLLHSVEAVPSTSVRIWLSVASRSSLSPNRDRPSPQVLLMAWISLMKMTHGAFLRAVAKTSRSRVGATPTNISTKSEPLTGKEGTPDSPASRFGQIVPRPFPGDRTDGSMENIGPLEAFGYLQADKLHVLLQIFDNVTGTKVGPVFAQALSAACHEALDERPRGMEALGMAARSGFGTRNAMALLPRAI